VPIDDVDRAGGDREEADPTAGRRRQRLLGYEIAGEEPRETSLAGARPARPRRSAPAMAYRRWARRQAASSAASRAPGLSGAAPATSASA
jgi:hypothetical protein